MSGEHCIPTGAEQNSSPLPLEPCFTTYKLSMSKPRVAIIGAGPTGLLCARFLRKLPTPPEVIIFEKSRSVGGRLATNTNFLHTPIDHGTSHFTLNHPFANQFVTNLVPDLRKLPSNAFVDTNGHILSQTHNLYYCASGNNAIAQKLADSLDVRFHHHVTSISPDATVKYKLAKDKSEDAQSFDLALITAPLPQAAVLLNMPVPASHIPCLTVLLAYNRIKLQNHPILSTASGRPPYAIVSDELNVYVDSFKRRARGNLVVLVVQASEGFSRQYLDSSEEEWSQKLTLNAEKLWDLPAAARVASFPKRWRYAKVEGKWMGELKTSDRILIAGDGVHGGGVEESIIEGQNVAKRISEILHLNDG